MDAERKKSLEHVVFMLKDYFTHFNLNLVANVNENGVIIIKYGESDLMNSGKTITKYVTRFYVLDKDESKIRLARDIMQRVIIDILSESLHSSCLNIGKLFATIYKD